MVLTLYMIPYSQPVRATLMTLEALNLEVILKEVNLLKNEQLTEEFRKINPQHTLPTFVDDDGFVLWESHAIMPYLVGKYGKNDSLYPKDFRKRAKIDQRLHFNNGVVFPLNILGPIIYKNEKNISQDKIDSLMEVYKVTEAFLGDHKWIAGDDLSIADFALLSTITSLDVVVPIDFEKFSKIAVWLENAKQLPYYHINEIGLAQIRKLVEEKLK